MSAINTIPQAFFDMLARVVPGLLGVSAALLLSENYFDSLLGNIIGPSVFRDGSVSLVGLCFFISAYVAGQIISPFAKLVQRIGELSIFNPALKAPDGAYDWLRMHHPDSGAMCAKIRAEFTMHNGLSVVFTSSAIWILITTWPPNAIPLFLILLGGLTAYRGRKTRDTFNETVRKFANAGGYGDSAST